MTNGQQPISRPWFVVGCVLTLVAIVAFFWGFALKDLTSSQWSLLMWLLPLSSGFACGCFAGSMHAGGTVGTLTISAVGGFAVWLLTFYLLPSPIPAKPPDSLSMVFKEGTSIRQAAEMIAKKEGFSVKFTCDENFLKATVQTDTMTAKGPQQLLGKLGAQTQDSSLRRQLRVTRDPDSGFYEVHCE